MVNVGFSWGSLIGILLAVAGAALYFLRSFKPGLARDYDIFFAAVGLLCGGILFFNSWRLDPILQFSQFLLTGSVIFFAYETIRLRQITTEQAKRNTPADVDDRPVSRVYRAELDDLDFRYEEPPTIPRRIRGSTEDFDRDEYERNLDRPVDRSMDRSAYDAGYDSGSGRRRPPAGRGPRDDFDGPAGRSGGREPGPRGGAGGGSRRSPDRSPGRSASRPPGSPQDASWDEPPVVARDDDRPSGRPGRRGEGLADDRPVGRRPREVGSDRPGRRPPLDDEPPAPRSNYRDGGAEPPIGRGRGPSGPGQPIDRSTSRSPAYGEPAVWDSDDAYEEDVAPPNSSRGRVGREPRGSEPNRGDRPGPGRETRRRDEIPVDFQPIIPPVSPSRGSGTDLNRDLTNDPEPTRPASRSTEARGQDSGRGGSGRTADQDAEARRREELDRRFEEELARDRGASQGVSQGADREVTEEGEPLAPGPGQSDNRDHPRDASSFDFLDRPDVHHGDPDDGPGLDRPLDLDRPGPGRPLRSDGLNRSRSTFETSLDNSADFDDDEFGDEFEGDRTLNLGR